MRKVKWEQGDTVSSIANYDQIQILKSTICLRGRLPPVLSLLQLFIGLNLACCLATEQLGSDDILCLPVTCQPSHIPSPRHLGASVLPMAFQMPAALSLWKSTAARLPLTTENQPLGGRVVPSFILFFLSTQIIPSSTIIKKCHNTHYSFRYFQR